METFEKAFKRFLSSLETKNLEEFKTFLHPDHDILIILPMEHPRGPQIKGYKNVIEEIQKIFSNTDDKLSFKIETIEASEDLGFGAVEANIELHEKYKPKYNRKVYISYLFRRIQGDWIFIHDQNTILK